MWKRKMSKILCLLYSTYKSLCGSYFLNYFHEGTNSHKNPRSNYVFNLTIYPVKWWLVTMIQSRMFHSWYAQGACSSKIHFSTNVHALLRATLFTSSSLFTFFLHSFLDWRTLASLLVLSICSRNVRLCKVGRSLTMCQCVTCMVYGGP